MSWHRGRVRLDGDPPRPRLVVAGGVSAATYLQIWDLSGGETARMRQRTGIAIPIESFPGILGTALAHPAPTVRFRRAKRRQSRPETPYAGGKVISARLRSGALLSAVMLMPPRAMAELCITAVEMSSTLTLRLDLQAGRAPHEPCVLTAGPLCIVRTRNVYFATTAHGPDLFDCSRRAVRYLVDHIVAERGLSREEAYILCSVCVDLKISQIVDAPNWERRGFSAGFGL